MLQNVKMLQNIKLQLYNLQFEYIKFDFIYKKVYNRNLQCYSHNLQF